MPLRLVLLALGLPFLVVRRVPQGFLGLALEHLGLVVELVVSGHAAAPRDRRDGGREVPGRDVT